MPADLSLAHMIAMNSADIQDTILELIEEVTDLRKAVSPKEGLEGISGGHVYHGLALRTAAGPDVFFRDLLKDEKALSDAITSMIYTSRVLGAMKATLFYGKDFVAPDMKECEELTKDFHSDFFSNYQQLHAILGICSEAGELLEDVVKMIALPDVLDVDENDRQKLSEESYHILQNMSREMGDIDWYQELFALTTGTPVDLSRRQNIERLQKRYPDKFSTEDAIARADEEVERTYPNEA